MTLTGKMLLCPLCRKTCLQQIRESQAKRKITASLAIFKFVLVLKSSLSVHLHPNLNIPLIPRLFPIPKQEPKDYLSLRLGLRCRVSCLLTVIESVTSIAFRLQSLVWYFPAQPVFVSQRTSPVFVSQCTSGTNAFLPGHFMSLAMFSS